MQNIQNMNESYSTGYLLRIGGLFTAVFSLLGGAIFTFAVPSSCSVVGGFGMVFFTILLAASIIAFVLGLVLDRRS